MEENFDIHANEEQFADKEVEKVQKDLIPDKEFQKLKNQVENQIVNEKGFTQPAEILNQLRDLIISALKQKGTFGENQDGMDISLLCFDEQKKTTREFNML